MSCLQRGIKVRKENCSNRSISSIAICLGRCNERRVVCIFCQPTTTGYKFNELKNKWSPADQVRHSKEPIDFLC